MLFAVATHFFKANVKQTISELAPNCIIVILRLLYSKFRLLTQLDCIELLLAGIALGGRLATIGVIFQNNIAS